LHRVALACYSHGLASYLERITATWPRRQQPAYVGEFHVLGVQWGAPQGPDESLRTEETVKFWEHDLPRQMAELAMELEPGHRFDSIVVDEAQDFADSWWEPLLITLKYPYEGGRLWSRISGRAGCRPTSPHAVHHVGDHLPIRL
jgi:hypothetical protein